MCIIAAKAKGIEMPYDEIIKNMWYANSDGAGLMYTRNGRVFIDKGYMSLFAFQERLEKLEKEINTKKEAVVLHFRIKTHGKINSENCHPFPITNKIEGLKKSMVVTDIGVSHNGIIPIVPRKDISDTMEYIASQLAPLKKAVPNFYKNKHLLKMIENAIGSKMVFMDGAGELVYIGSFNESNGIKYSNYSHKGYSCFRNYAWDWEDDGYSVSYSNKNEKLCWIKEDEYFIKTPSGELLESYDYLFDQYHLIYKYNWKNNTASRVYGYTVYSHEGTTVFPSYDKDKAELIMVNTITYLPSRTVT